MKHKLQNLLKHKLQWLMLLAALLGVSQGVWGTDYYITGAVGTGGWGKWEKMTQSETNIYYYECTSLGEFKFSDNSGYNENFYKQFTNTETVTGVTLNNNCSNNGNCSLSNLQSGYNSPVRVYIDVSTHYIWATATEVPINYYLRGTIPNVGWDNNTAMTNSSGTYTYSVNITASNNTYTFKLYKSTNQWLGNDTSITGTTTITEFFFADSGDKGGGINIRANITGEYTFEFNVSAQTLTVTYPSSCTTPTASNFNIGTSSYSYDGTRKSVSVSAKYGSPTINVYYEGINGTSYSKSTTAPNAAGMYRVTINATAASTYCAVSNLEVATLIIGYQITIRTSSSNVGDLHPDNIYAWITQSSTDYAILGAWPGTALTTSGSNKELTFYVPSTSVKFIINGNNKQTVNITQNPIVDGGVYCCTMDGSKSGDKYNASVAECCTLPSTLTANPTTTPADKVLAQGGDYTKPTSVSYTLPAATVTSGSGYTLSWSVSPASSGASVTSGGTTTTPTIKFEREGKFTAKITASCSSTTMDSETALIVVKPGPLYLGGPFICGTASSWDAGGIGAQSRTISEGNIIYTFVWESKWTSSDAATNSKGLFSLRSRRDNGGGNIVNNYATTTLNGGLAEITDGGNKLLKSSGLSYAVGDVLKLTVTFTGYGDSPSYTPQYTMKLEKVCTKPTAVSISGTTPISFAENAASVGTSLTASTTPTDASHDTYTYAWSSTSVMSGTEPSYSSSSVYNPTVTFYREGQYTIQAGARCPTESGFTPTAKTNTKDIVVNPNKLYLSGPLYSGSWSSFIEIPKNNDSYTYIKEWNANTSKSGDDQKYFTVTRTQTQNDASITVNKYAYISTNTGITPKGGDYNYFSPSISVSSGDRLRLKVVYTGTTNGSTPNKKPVYTFALDKITGGSVGGSSEVCSGAEFTLTLSSATSTDVTRQWQRATRRDASTWNAFVAIPDEHGATLTTSQTVDTRYRVEITTASGQSTVYSTVKEVTVLPDASLASATISSSSTAICSGSSATASITGAVLGGGTTAWSIDGTGVSIDSSNGAITTTAASAGTVPVITYTITDGCGTGEEPISLSASPLTINGVSINRTPSTVHGYEVTTLSASPAKNVTWHIQSKPGGITTNQAYFVKDDGKATASDVSASSIIFKGKGTSGGGNSYTVRATDGTCTTDETFSVINDATESCN